MAESFFLQAVKDDVKQSFFKSLDAFEIERMIGKGQFSSVFRARVKSTNETVALKKVKIFDMLDKKARLDCMKEINLLQQLSHPNVIKYLGSWVHCGELVIVLELANAGDISLMLHCFRRRRRLLPECSVWKYFVQICAGLTHMHNKRVMHRDIKPANIFVTSQGVVKLGDLGLGRFFSIKTMAAHSLVGTPYYMSPERIHEAGYTFSSDIWSLGCLLYEMQLLIRKCISADPSSRPNIQYVYGVAQDMDSRRMLRNPIKLQPPSTVSIRRVPHHSSMSYTLCSASVHGTRELPSAKFLP